MRYQFYKYTFLFICIFSISVVYAQKKNVVLFQYQDSINQCFQEIIKTDIDSIKYFHNSKIIQHFDSVFVEQESFEFSFDSLRNMGILTAPDNKFRLYNWNLQLNDGTFEYFGFLQVKTKAKKEYLIYKLHDHSSNVESPEKATLSNLNWYGALYYQIVLAKEKQEKFYTLLGWDGHNDFTNRKIIDVLYFTKSDKPKFGKNLFKLGKIKQKRIVFEYSYLASMTLKYNEKLNMIVYDHLAPSSPKFEGQYQYYGPDFSYDGLYFKNGKWIEEKNIDVRNPKTKTRKKNISYTF